MESINKFRCFLQISCLISVCFLGTAIWIKKLVIKHHIFRSKCIKSPQDHIYWYMVWYHRYHGIIFIKSQPISNACFMYDSSHCTIQTDLKILGLELVTGTLLPTVWEPSVKNPNIFNKCGKTPTLKFSTHYAISSKEIYVLITWAQSGKENIPNEKNFLMCLIKLYFTQALYLKNTFLHVIILQLVLLWKQNVFTSSPRQSTLLTFRGNGSSYKLYGLLCPHLYSSGVSTRPGG